MPPPSASSGPPLAGRYGAAVAIVLLGLAPNIVLTTAATPLGPVVAGDLGTSADAVQVVEGLSNAGYAFGAVLAAFLAQRFVSRRLFIGYEAAFVVGSLAAALAPDLAVFAAGRVVQGTATGFMLVAALPPLVTRFGVGRLPVTVAVVDVGLFGATTLGPVLGGLAVGSWRLLVAGTAVLGALGLLAAALGYARFEPYDRDAQLDRSAVALALVGTAATFYATSSLPAHGFASALFWVPFVAGTAAVVALVVIEYRKDAPLMPVEALSTQLPVTGTLVAMLAGAAVVVVLQLVQRWLDQVASLSPAAAGLLFLPMPAGAAVAAVAFGLVFRTRWMPVLVVVGLLAIGAGAAVLLGADPAAPAPLVLTATGLLGFGAGATVSPGLFLAALGVASQLLGRAFALVELLRSAAAFAVAPVVLYAASAVGDAAAGVRLGLEVALVLVGLGLLAALGIPLLSGARLRAPDLESWLERGGQGLPSPVTAVHVRPGRSDEAAEPLLPVRRRR